METKLKVGDRVVQIHCRDGSIGTVEKTGRDWTWVDYEGRKCVGPTCCYALADAPVTLEGTTAVLPEPPAPKFKVGDRVVTEGYAADVVAADGDSFTVEYCITPGLHHRYMLGGHEHRQFKLIYPAPTVDGDTAVLPEPPAPPDLSLTNEAGFPTMPKRAEQVGHEYAYDTCPDCGHDVDHPGSCNGRTQSFADFMREREAKPWPTFALGDLVRYTPRHEGALVIEGVVVDQAKDFEGWDLEVRRARGAIGVPIIWVPAGQCEILVKVGDR